MKLGFVGAGSDKFTPEQTQSVRRLIRDLIDHPEVTAVVSGHSPLGGVDLWAEDIGAQLKKELDIKAPHQQSWAGEYGYRDRNLDIAHSSDMLHIIVSSAYPTTYHGIRFKECYHCVKHHATLPWHVKSGGCWTGWQALKLGKQVMWHIV